MHLCEGSGGGKKKKGSISPLIAVSLSTCTYESSQSDLIILTGQIVLDSSAPSILLKLVVDRVGPNRGVLNVAGLFT